MTGEIRFLHCGNGDTILIRGGDEWALVDANLTARSGAVNRLEAILREHGVRRLRFVCVTHFDADHIRGLGRFLRKHFGPNDTDRDKWEIEQVILPVRPSRPFWRKLFCSKRQYQLFCGRDDDATTPFVELFNELRDMGKRDHRIFPAYDPRTNLVSRDLCPTSASLGPWDVWFLGPSIEVEGRYMITFGNNPLKESTSRHEWPKILRRNVERNETSKIIALCHRETADTVLLTGDATAASIEEALQQWANVRFQAGMKPFRIVKASHHGAWTERPADNCHYDELYHQHCDTQHSEVVISCGNEDERHPHANMIGCVQTKGIRSVSTGVPVARPARQIGMGMPLGAPYDSYASQPEDVIFRVVDGKSSLTGGHIRSPVRAST